MADASNSKVDRASEVAKAMNEIMRFESADQGHLLDVVMNYFLEDNEQQSEDSDLDSDDDSGPEMDVPSTDPPPVDKGTVYIYTYTQREGKK